MKIRFNKRGFFLSTFFLFVIFSTYHFFYLFKYGKALSVLLGVYNIHIIFIVLSLAYGLLSVSIKHSPWLQRYLILVFLSVLIELGITIMRYPLQNIVTSIRVAASFCSFILASVFLDYLLIKKDSESVFKLLNLISLVWNLYIVLQIIIYNTYGTFVFDFASYFASDTVSMRNGMVRIGVGMFTECSIFYNFTKIYGEKNRTFDWVYHLLCFIIDIYCVIFISQSRANIIYVLVALLIGMIAIGGNIKSLLFKSFSVILFSYLIIFTEFLDKFISSFNAIGEYKNSINNRVYSVRYFLECILKHPLVGNGFAYTGENTPYFQVEHGSLGVACYGDVGFLGLLAYVGIIFSVIFYLIPLFRMGKILIANIKQIGIDNSLFLLEYYVYLVLTSISLLMIDKCNMVQMAFLMAYFEYINLRRKSK